MGWRRVSLYVWMIGSVSLLTQCNRKGGGSSGSIPMSQPSVNGSGGMPADTSDVGALSADEAKDLRDQVLNVSQTLIPSFSQSSAASLRLADGKEDCTNNPTCLMRNYSKILQIATSPVVCNMNHIFVDETDTKVELRQVDGTNIYFQDFFGSLGVNPSSEYDCASITTVRDWAKARGLAGGAPSGAEVSKSVFYHVRFVIYKTNAGKVIWKLVYFPKDFFPEIASRIPALGGLADKSLDYIAVESEYDGNTGSITINWNRIKELYANVVAVIGSQDFSDNLPSGKVKIAVDERSDVKNYQITLQSDFKFIELEKSSIIVDNPALHLISGDEHYFRAQVGTSYLSANAAKPGNTDDFTRVYFCDNPNYPSTSIDPTADIRIKDIPVASYLHFPEEYYIQTMWRSGAKVTDEPADWDTLFTATQGGKFVYGMVTLEHGGKGGAASDYYRLKAPLCPTLNNGVMANINTAMGTPYFDTDDQSSTMKKVGTSSVSYVPSATATASYGTFDKFKFIKINADDDNPVK